MDATHNVAEEQAARWNGPAARAWIDAQDVLDRLFKPLEDLLVRSVAERAPNAVLDVGCGTGSTTLAVARHLGANGRATGIDISEPMTAVARARAEHDGVTARFITADAQTHPFEPASADMIISRFGVMFFADPVQAFANLRRAATDDAALRLIAWRSAADNPFMTTAERAAAPLLPQLPPRRPDGPGQFAFADATHVQAIFERSGWATIEMRPIDVECTLPEAELVQYLTRLGPVGLALQDADDRTRAEVAKTVRAAFEPYVSGSDARFTAACWLISR